MEGSTTRNEEMNFRLLIPLFLGVVLASCESDANIPSSATSAQPLPSASSGPTQNNSGWSAELIKIPGNESLVDLQMVTSSIGVTITPGGSAYQTLDGGRQWRQLNGKLPASSSAQSFFVNETLGWAVITKPSTENGKTTDYDAQIFNTQNGGDSWRLQHTVKNGYLNNVTFTSPSRGWAIGSTRKVRGDSESEHIQILQTNNGGRTWKEVSNSLIASLENDTAQDIVVETETKISVLTLNGKLLLTENFGRDWRVLDSPQVAPQLANLRLVKGKEDALFLLRATNGREGIRTNIAKLDSRGQWSSKETEGWYLSDLLLLSDREMVACGFIRSKNSQEIMTDNVGIVVTSSDGGETWSVVYQDETVARVEALARLSATEFLAAGANGSIFKFTKR